MKEVSVENLKKVNINNWSEFIVGELFSISRGQRQKAEYRTKGDIPYYSASNDNNGMTDKIGNPKFIDKDTIIGTTFGDFYYVEGYFSGSDEITIYHHPKIDGNKYIGLYMTSVLKQNKHKYSFKTKMFTNDAKKDVIYLPVDANGEPDWLYMKNYMRNIEKKVIDSLSNLEKIKNIKRNEININDWADFQLGKIINKSGKSKGNGIFNIFHSGAYHNKDVEEINVSDLNYVTRSKFNNGIKCKIIEKEDYVINPSGTISFGAENANFFYQENKYITGNKMYYIDTRHLSKNCALFLKTILEATFTNNFSYSDAMTPERIYNKTIKLPVDLNGNPDWDYMDKYISNINDKVKKI